MVSDTEPRYRLVDSGGTVVGTLYAQGDGTLALQEGTSGSDNEVTIQTDGTLGAPAVSTGEVGNSGSPFTVVDGVDLPEGERIRNATENSTEQFVQVQNENLAVGGKTEIIPNVGKDSLLGTAIVNCDSGSASGIVAFGGGANSAYIVADPNNSFSTTEDNDGTVNFYYDAGNSRYEVNNELGFQQDLRIYYFN